MQWVQRIIIMIPAGSSHPYHQGNINPPPLKVILPPHPHSKKEISGVRPNHYFLLPFMICDRALAPAPSSSTYKDSTDFCNKVSNALQLMRFKHCKPLGSHFFEFFFSFFYLFLCFYSYLDTATMALCLCGSFCLKGTFLLAAVVSLCAGCES